MMSGPLLLPVMDEQQLQYIYVSSSGGCCHFWHTTHTVTITGVRKEDQLEWE